MIWLTLFAACNTNGIKGILKQSECPPELDVFTEHVWEPVLSGQCMACHVKNGVAEESGLKLDPSDLTATMASTIQVAEWLAAKPSGTHPDGHGGGRVVQVGSDEHRALLFWKDWVGGTCELPKPRSCGEEEPAERLLRRLTHAEYDRTVTDLLGFEVRAGEKFASDPVVDGFRNDAHALVVGDLLADQYASSSESLAAAVDVRSLVDCDPGAEGEGTCAAVFVEDFGFRAFRRPLTVTDLERYVGLWSEVATAEGYEEGLRWVVIAMLQSPHFLYRPELGVQVEPGLFQLTDWEMASALSYALWGTMPDAALFEAAADGALSSPDDIEAQILRMMGGGDGAPLDDRLGDRAVGFLDAWLDLGQLSTVSREGLTPELRESLRLETETLMRDLAGEDAGLSDLMGARHTTLDPLLAEHYGLGQTGLVDLDGERYGGLLTQGSVLTTYARPTGSSPVHRGVLVRERLLCEHLPPPPSNLDTSPPEVDPDQSTRERYSQHGSDPECAVCHDAIDPLGFAFEHYDQLGRWRSDDAGHTVDDSGAVDEVPFVGPFQLSDVLLDDERFRSCFVQTWRRHVRGSYACGDDLGVDVGLVSPLVDVPATYGYRHRTAGAEEGDTFALGDRPGTVPDVPTGGGDVRFNVVVNNDWGTGYCADGSVTNGSDATVTWSGRWPQDGTINNIWNASYTEQGGEWEFRGADFNAELEPGGIASFGFCADR